MLVPGIMVVATAILLITANHKYSTIVSRIRGLKEARSEISEPGEGLKKGKKIDRIELQLSHLIHRISLVRITILSYSSAIFFFLVVSILLAIRSTFEVNGYHWVVLGFFFSGLLAMLNGIVFAVIEVFKAYRIIQIEISEINHS
jgi:hypothetical protein